MEPSTGEIVRRIILLVLAVVAVGFVVVLSIWKSEEPKSMVVKWIFTAGVLYLLFGKVGGIVGQGGYSGAFVGIPLTAACGIVLAIIWRHSIAALIANPFGSLYDGGTQPPDPRPAYSVARARQKSGLYLEALAEAQKQLERFPTDVEGQMLVAQIQAEDLKDLPAAELTIEQFCAQPGHAPKNIAFALYSMADWHLAIGHDPDSARQWLQKILVLLPDTEMAMGAAQRIAHMTPKEMLLDAEEQRKFTVKEGEPKIGLHTPREPLLPEETPPQMIAGELVKHLETYPLDTDAREKLASIYADYYHRADLAADQLEQMINDERQPAKSVVRWLNMLADIQVRTGATHEEVVATLQRIIGRDPGLAAAELARQRMARLKLEFKAQQKSQAVKLGSYEQNIGLKRGLPNKL